MRRTFTRTTLASPSKMSSEDALGLLAIHRKCSLPRPTFIDTDCATHHKFSPFRELSSFGSTVAAEP